MPSLKKWVLLIIPACASFGITALVEPAVHSLPGWEWLDIIWLVALTILNYNVFFVTIGGIFSLFPVSCHSYTLNTLPHTAQAALVISLKNETGLEDIIMPNVLANQDVLSEVIILSNSTDAERIAEEKRVLADITRVGITATHIPSKPPKHVAMYDFIRSRTDIQWMATCDADTFYPAGSIKKLLLKAHHPLNHDVAIFQSHVTAHPGKTYFSNILSIGQNTTAQLYAYGFFNALGAGGYYGSGALINREYFQQAADAIENAQIIDVPAIRSHDVWEAVTLPKLSRHVHYCMDVETQEGFPNNYMEMVIRDRRWMKGTLQSIKALKVLPHQNTLGTLGILLFPIAMYVFQPVFVAFIVIGLVRVFTSDISQWTLHAVVTAVILGFIFGQKFLATRRTAHVVDIFIELVFSTLFYINTPLFTTLNVLTLWMPEEWIVMPKQPTFTSISRHIRFFWIHELCGLLGIILFILVSDVALVFSLPIFVILFMSGISSYLFQFEVVAFDGTSNL